MVSFLLLGLCLLSTAAGLQSFGDLVMFAKLGDDITLPCGIPSIKSCSSVNWNMAGDYQLVDDVVVKAGRVTSPRLGLLEDCSLQINHLVLDDARIYTCYSGALNSSVSLQILEVTERPTPQLSSADDIIELHCFLNTYKGLAPCKHKGIQIKWTTEDNTPLNGSRFKVENPSGCFSKLFITKKLTDHHRKWKCQLHQNDTIKVTTTYTTTVKDGVEEVFAAVGESVSLSCSNTSSLAVGGGVKWAVGERTLTDDLTPHKGQTEAFHVNKDSSLVINKVSAVHTGDYQCSESTDEQKVFNRVRLHTLDVTSEREPGGDNITLTCVLTCTKECGKDLNVTWSGGSQNSWQSGLMNRNNTLIKRLFLPVSSSDKVTCFAHREGDVMVSKKYGTVNPLKTPAWVALPLALLICITAGGLYMYMKRKHNTDAGSEQPSIGMTPVYEVIEDANDEKLHQQRETKRGTAATTDSFYDLLQAVN